MVVLVHFPGTIRQRLFSNVVAYLENVSRAGRHAVIAIFLTSFLLAAGTLAQQTRTTQTADAVEQYVPCNCVIFRFDDITDYTLPKAKITMMNDFIERKIHLSLGVVAAHLGNYPSTGVYNKTVEGVKSGLFEVTIHGNHHDDYSAMNLTTQRTELSAAQGHIESLFGAKSRIFMPPYNQYNQDTVAVLAEQGISVMGASVNFDNGVTNTYYLSDGNGTQYQFYTHNAKLKMSSVNGKIIYHIPHNSASFFVMHDENKFAKAAEDEIEKRVQQSVADRGYGIVVLHPGDFVNVVNGTNQDSINATRHQELTDVINWVVARYPTTSYSNLMGTTWFMDESKKSTDAYISGYAGHNQRFGEMITSSSSLTQKQVNTMHALLKKVNNPTGTAYFKVLDPNLNTKYIFGSINVSKLTTTQTEYTLVNRTATYTIASNDRLVVEYTGGDIKNSIKIAVYANGDIFDGGNTIRVRYTNNTWITAKYQDTTIGLGFTHDVSTHWVMDKHMVSGDNEPKLSGYNGYNKRVGELITSASSLLAGDEVNTMRAALKKSGSPTGTAYFKVLDPNLNTKYIFGSINVSKLATTQRVHSC